jgi:hypothetical protein
MTSRRSLVVATCVAALGCKGTKIPVAPSGLVATAGDQKVHLHWDPSKGANDYVVYYNTEAKGLDKTTATAIDTGSNATDADVPALRNATSYKFAIAARNSAGESPLSDPATATPRPDNALMVASLDPPANATAVTRAPIIRITFNRPVVPETVTVNVSSSSCTGVSLQVSLDNFATCVQMRDAPIVSDSNKTYVVRPASPLAGNTVYQIRLTSDVLDPTGGKLETPFVSSFTTNLALAFASTNPPEGKTGVQLRPTLVITFNRAANAVTVTTNTGDPSCSGSVQLSRLSDNFARCVIMAGAPATTDNKTFTVTPASPLAGSTQYKLRVTAGALDTDGVGPAGALELNFTTDVALAVVALSPADGSSGAPLNSPVSVTFSKLADPLSITTNTADTSCSGSIQVSLDSFSTCARMQAAPATSDNKTFTVVPATPLNPSTTYKVRVRTDARDQSGVPLATAFTSGIGFATNSALTVTSISPFDGATSVAINTPVVVTFNRPVQPASITVDSTSTCSPNSAVQLSADNFASCVPMSGATATAGNTSFVITPAALLSSSTSYRVRINGVIDATNVPSSIAVTNRGFSTATLISVSSSPTNGQLQVALNTPVVLSFNHTMDPASLTVSTSGSACTGSLQLSADGFITCVPMAAAPTASGANHTFAVSAAAPLSPTTLYAVRITTAVKDSAGVPLQANTQVTFTTATALAVTQISPADGSTNGALNPNIAITFNRAAQSQSLTVNTADTSCSGSVQVSRALDGFAANTCVRMQAAPSQIALLQYSVTPAAPLAASTTYLVRVTTSAKDSDGVALAATFTSATGFTTGPALSVTGTTPASGAAAVALNTPITVTLNKPALVASLTTNTSSTACSGSLQLSADPAFATCVPMSASPVPGSGNTTFTVQPAALLSPSTQYRIRLSTAAQDATGVALGSAFTLAAPFTTNAAIAVASTSPATTPANGAAAAAVPVNSSIGVTFSRAADPSSITANNSGTACAGSLQLSADNFTTCVRMAQQPVASSGNLTFTVTPAVLLNPAPAVYKIRLTSGAHDADGVPLSPAYTSAIGFSTDVALSVATTAPIDGQTGVALNSAVVINFNKSVAAGSVLANTGSTACTGTVQLSRSGDNFSSCVRIGSFSASGGTVTLQPFAPLDGSTTYRIRVTTGVTDAFNVPLPAQYDSAAGFFTDVALAVTSTLPADGSSVVPLNSSISVTFNKQAQNITANAGTLCSGTLQLSRDGFSSCVPTSAVSADTTGKIFTVTPLAPLDGNAAYKIKVTAAALDMASVPLGTDFISPSGFLTDAALEVVSTTPANGAIAVALNSTIAVTFNKAADGTTLIASTNGSCAGTTLQVSDDPGFATCVKMIAAAPQTSNGGRTFTVTPASTLAASTSSPHIYKVRVTTGARDLAPNGGVAIANTFTSPTGFATDQALSVASTSPANSAAGVPLNASIQVTFNKAALPSSITANTLSAACSGSLQLSDSAGGCVQMKTAPVASANNTVFTVTPSQPLLGQHQYTIVVTAAARDAAGVALAPAFSGLAFTTDIALGVSSVTPSGSGPFALNSPVTAVFNKPVLASSITTNTVDTQCSGTLQVSDNNFGSCAQMLAAPVANSSSSFTVTPAGPLDAASTYQVRVMQGARDAAGVNLGAPSTPVSFITDVALQVSLPTSPADASNTIALNAPVTVTFNRAVNATSVTTNSADTSCSGSLQLSRAVDNFATCVRMSAAIIQSGNSFTMSLPSGGLLAASTLYKLRVTTGLVDAAGVPFQTAYTMGTGFTTDQRLAVSTTAPVDGAAAAPRNSAIAVNFNKAVRTTTVTVNTTDTTCAGYSLQVSSDNFNTCVKMSSTFGIAISNANQTFTVSPASPLAGSTVYRIKVTTAVLDTAPNTGVPMAATFVSTTGFTAKPALAVSSTSPATGATQVRRNPNMQIVFNRPALVSSFGSATCTGPIQIVNLTDSSCVAGTVAAAGTQTTDTIFNVTPVTLAGDTQYQIVIGTAAQDSDGVPLASAITAASFRTNIAMAVTSVSPSGTAVQQNPAISVTFNRAPALSSMTVTPGGGACTGAIQLATDSIFPGTNCVAMSAPPASSNGGLTWTVTLPTNALLVANTQYFVRVVGVSDADGVSFPQGVAGNFTTRGSFQVVTPTSPADGATLVKRNTSVSFTLSFAADPMTLTNDSAPGACDGSVQLALSTSGFAPGTCVPLSAPTSSDNKTWTVQPQTLAGGFTFQLKVKSSVRDTFGVPLTPTFVSPSGFTTNITLDMAAVSPFTPTGTSVPRNSPLSVTFNRTADPNSLKVISSGTACGTSTLQLQDSLSNCVPLSAPTTSDNKTFNFNALAPLTGGASYTLVVKAAATDSDGVPLGADKTSPSFTAKPEMMFSSATPSGAGPFRLNTPISVTFTRPPKQMPAATITTNTADSSCSGSLQVSRVADNFTTCVRMSAAPACMDSPACATWQVTPLAPLDPSIAYWVRVTSAAQDSDGVPFNAPPNVATFTTKAAMVVSSTSPAASASAVALNTAVVINFSRAADPNSLNNNINTTGTTCTGSVQISKDPAFGTCVKLGSATGSGTSYSVQPFAALEGQQNYFVRVAPPTADSDLVPISPVFTTATPFTTKAAMVVSSTSPAASASAVALNTTVVVNFSRAPTTSTVNAQTTTGPCSGSVQLSSDNFTTCQAMTLTTNASPSFTFTPNVGAANGLAGSTQFRIRVTTSAQDSDGAPMPSQFDIAAPFTTDTPLSLSSATPADGAAAPQKRNQPIVLTFSRAVDATTVTSNTGCTGNVRVTATTGSPACADLIISPTTGTSSSFTLTENTPLRGSTTYKINVTAGVKDLAGVSIGNPLAQSTGFTTSPELLLTSPGTSPVNGATGVALNAKVILKFNRAITTTTLIANNSSNCTGATVTVSQGAPSTTNCVAITSVTQGSGNTFTLQPAGLLPAGATLQINLTTGLQDSDGVAFVPTNTANSPTLPSGFTVNPYLQVSTTAPADNAPAQARNVPLTITFNRALGTTAQGTLTTDATASCNGSILISKQLPSVLTWTTCVALSAPASVPSSCTAGACTQFTVQPQQPLDGSATYYVRVMQTVTDDDGVQLTPQFDMVNGFATKAALSIFSLSPAANATAVSRTLGPQYPSLGNVVITFNRDAKDSTVTAAGDVQLSKDSFATTVPLGTITSPDHMAFTAPITQLLAGNSTYKLQLSGIQDGDGVPMATFSSSPGFLTNPALQVNTATATSSDTSGVAINSAFSIVLNRAAKTGTVNTSATSTCGSATITLSTGAPSGTNCIPATIASTNGGVTWTLTPSANLVPGTVYTLTVVSGASGVLDATDSTQLAPFTSATFTAQATLAVTTTSPGDALTPLQPLNSFIQITFNKPPKTESLSTITTGTACGTSTMQLSTDNFVTCVPMTAAAPTAVSSTVFKIVAASNLQPNTVYKIKVLQSVTDLAGFTMAGNYVSANGFQTKVAFTPSFFVVTSTGSTAAEGATNVSRNTYVDVVFTRPANPSTVTVTTLTSPGACQGSLQVSTDGFVTCLPLTKAPNNPPVDNISYYRLTLATFAANTNVRVRVLGTVQDSDGIALGSTVSTPTGFTTAPVLAVSSSTPANNDVNVALAATITLNFNTPASVASLTSGTCATSTVLLSTDSTFATGCITLTPAPASGNAATVVFTPAAPLAKGATYFLRVKTAGAQDFSGFAGATQYDASFQTIPFTLTVTVTGAGGTVTSSPAGISCTTGTCSSPFATGASVTLTASADATHAFTGWTGACTTSPCTVTMNSDQAVTATFVPTYAVTVTVTGTGTVGSSPAGISACAAGTGTCSARFNQGTNITLTETPGSSFVFRTWGSACASSASGTTCPLNNISADQTVTAAFDPAPTATLTATPGTIGPNGLAIVVPTFANGNATLTKTPQGSGSTTLPTPTSNSNIAQRLTVTTSYQLTVTNAVNTSATATASATVTVSTPAAGDWTSQNNAGPFTAAQPDMTTGVSPRVLAFDLSNDNSQYVTGSNQMLRTTTGAPPWNSTTVNFGSSNGVTVAHPNGALSVWSLTNCDGDLYHFDGTTWTEVTGAANGLLAKTCTSPAKGVDIALDISDSTQRTIWVAFSASVYRSTDDGTTWTAVSPTLAGSENLTKLAITDSGTVFAASNAGNLFTRTAAATSWTNIVTSGTQSITALSVDPTGAKVVLGKADGKIWTSSNSGSAFTAGAQLGGGASTFTAGSGGVNGLVVAPDGSTYAIANRRVFRSADWGLTFADVTTTGVSATPPVLPDAAYQSIAADPAQPLAVSVAGNGLGVYKRVFPAAIPAIPTAATVVVGLTSPATIAVDTGYVYFRSAIDATNDRVSAVYKGGGKLTSVAPGTNLQARGLLPVVNDVFFGAIGAGGTPPTGALFDTNIGAGSSASAITGNTTSLAADATTIFFNTTDGVLHSAPLGTTTPTVTNLNTVTSPAAGIVATQLYAATGATSGSFSASNLYFCGSFNGTAGLYQMTKTGTVQTPTSINTSVNGPCAFSGTSAYFTVFAAGQLQLRKADLTTASSTGCPASCTGESTLISTGLSTVGQATTLVTDGTSVYVSTPGPNGTIQKVINLSTTPALATSPWPVTGQANIVGMTVDAASLYWTLSGDGTNSVTTGGKVQFQAK